MSPPLKVPLVPHLVGLGTDRSLTLTPWEAPTGFRLVEEKHQHGGVDFLCFYVPRKMVLLLTNKPQHARGDERRAGRLGIMQGKGEAMER